MSRINVSLLSQTFAAFALFLCVHSFFFSPETEIKTQSIYWFCVALVASIIPYIKEVATYIESIKLGDIEIALNEVRKELQRVDDKVDVLDNKLLVSLSQVHQSEAALSKEARDNRQQIYEESAEVLALLPPDKRVKLQERLTRNHLNNIGIQISDLKEVLHKLTYYQGSIDNTFSLDLVQAIETFQAQCMEGQPDGIVGPMTLAKIAEMLMRKPNS